MFKFTLFIDIAVIFGVSKMYIHTKYVKKKVQTVFTQFRQGTPVVKSKDDNLIHIISKCI